MKDLSSDSFLEVVNLELERLPTEFKDKLENVSVLVEDLPTEFQYRKIYKDKYGGMLLGLYEGVPHTKRRGYGIGGALPDKITLFRVPLIRISGTKDQLKLNIRNTLLHEIAHHFGMDEESVRRAQGRI